MSKKIFDAFDRKDVAQMLTSLFIIIQTYSLPTVLFDIMQAFMIAVLSIFVCFIILWIVSYKDVLKHLMIGIILVSILSLIGGLILYQPFAKILIAFSVGLPVASMINALKS